MKRQREYRIIQIERGFIPQIKYKWVQSLFYFWKMKKESEWLWLFDEHEELLRKKDFVRPGFLPAPLPPKRERDGIYCRKEDAEQAIKDYVRLLESEPIEKIFKVEVGE